MERVKLTARMAEFTAAIDFTLVEDGLDTRRFNELLAALPADLAARSEDWVASFLSEKQEGEAYNVLEKVLILPESLANPNAPIPASASNLLNSRQRSCCQGIVPAGQPS